MDSIWYICISWTVRGYWMVYITFERGCPQFSNTTAAASVESKMAIVQPKIFCVYQRRTWDEFKRVLSVAHASQPVERAENLEYRNQLSGVCWGADYSSIESLSLNHPVYTKTYVVMKFSFHRASDEPFNYCCHIKYSFELPGDDFILNNIFTITTGWITVVIVGLHICS